MGVSTKGRRTIICDSRTYVWHVALDEESPYHVLQVVSSDKRLILSCPLDHPGKAYVIARGRYFQGENVGSTGRYLLPFPIPESVTPRFVAALVEWATNGREAVRVEWDGNAIPL